MPPEIVLNESGHTYLVDGVLMPSVTQILKFSGMIRTGFYTEESRQFGTAVHAVCEYYDRGVLKMGSVHERVAPRLEAWKAFRAEHCFTPLLIEAMFYHQQYRYCGRLDREGLLDGYPTVLDIKTGVPQPWAALQLAAYDMLIPDRKVLRKRAVVQLKEDGTYKLTYYTDAHDCNQFLSCVSNYWWAQNHGIKGD